MSIGDSENDVFKNMTIGDAKHRPITKNERVQFLAALQGTDSKSIPMFLDEWRQLVESKDMPEDEKRREKDRAAGWIAKFTPLARNPKKMRDALIKEQKRQQNQTIEFRYATLISLSSRSDTNSSSVQT
jgi:hypothetical protein